MNILGISGGLGHDSAAALVVDGAVIAACEEERFTRQKRAMRQPAMHSVQACLDIGGLSLSDVNCIAIGWCPDLAPRDTRLQENLALFTNSPRMRNSGVMDVQFVSHHRAHAALGYFTSTFTNAAVLVIDGQGEDVATTIYHAQGRTLQEMARFDIADSLGFFYAAITQYLGFTPGSAGKTMGLAALGSLTYEFPEIELRNDGYTVRMGGSNKSARMAGWMSQLEAVFGPSAATEFSMDTATGRLQTPRSLPEHLRNAAASAQAALERCLSHLVQLAFDMTGSPNVVLSGGVALNCTANGRLRGIAGNRGMFVSGAVHDGGTALGAALAVAAERGEVQQPQPSSSLFLGPAFAVDSSVIHARRLGLVVDSSEIDVAHKVSTLLSQNKVGGWFRGRSEYGPRALGGRSIIGRADAPAIRDRVNGIKRRELWRPLSPAMTPKAAASVGIVDNELDYMVEARWVEDTASAGPLAGIVHADNSVRPLVVRAEEHPFADLLDAVERQTGAGVLINTSFNQEYEPMINSPFDALRTFASSDLDFLVLENVVLQKPT